MAILSPNSARASSVKAPAKTTTAGRPALPSQLAPIKPVAPIKPAAPVRAQAPMQPNRPMQPQLPLPTVKPGAGGGMPPPQMGGTPAQMPQQPPMFNIPSPVPVLSGVQPPAVNLNPTPGQISNQVPPQTGPLGTAPPSIGGGGGAFSNAFLMPQTTPEQQAQQTQFNAQQQVSNTGSTMDQYNQFLNSGAGQFQDYGSWLLKNFPEQYGTPQNPSWLSNAATVDNNDNSGIMALPAMGGGAFSNAMRNPTYG